AAHSVSPRQPLVPLRAAVGRLRTGHLPTTSDRAARSSSRQHTLVNPSDRLAVLTCSGDDQEALRPFRAPVEPSPQAFGGLPQGFPPPRKPPAQPRQYAVVMNLLQHESGFEQDPPYFPQRERIGRG